MAEVIGGLCLGMGMLSGFIFLIDASGEGSFGCEVKGRAAISCDELRSRARQQRLSDSMADERHRRQCVGW